MAHRRSLRRAARDRASCARRTEPPAVRASALSPAPGPRDLCVRSGDELLAVWHEFGHLLGPLARLAALTLP